MPADTDRVKWVRASDGFYRSGCGRFDLIFVPDVGYWLAVDANAGKVFRHLDCATCELWCDRRAEGAERGSDR